MLFLIYFVRFFPSIYYHRKFIILWSSLLFSILLCQVIPCLSCPISAVEEILFLSIRHFFPFVSHWPLSVSYSLLFKCTFFWLFVWSVNKISDSFQKLFYFHPLDLFFFLHHHLLLLHILFILLILFVFLFVFTFYLPQRRWNMLFA